MNLSPSLARGAADRALSGPHHADKHNAVILQRAADYIETWVGRPLGPIAVMAFDHGLQSILALQEIQLKIFCMAGGSLLQHSIQECDHEPGKRSSAS